MAKVFAAIGLEFISDLRELCQYASLILLIGHQHDDADQEIKTRRNSMLFGNGLECIGVSLKRTQFEALKRPDKDGRLPIGLQPSSGSRDNFGFRDLA